MSCHCGVPTVWDDQALSLLCSGCGALLDSSQSLLVSNDQHYSSPLTTLRAFRSNWDLAGQGKDARNRKNEYVMSQLIKSLAMSLNAPGLSPRAIHIFNQAMSTTGLHWGTQAKRAAAASVALAMREASRPHHLHDIASMLNEPYPSLSRAFLLIATKLGISYKSFDPSIYISSLQSHLDSLLQDSTPNPSLSASLMEQLRTLDFRSVVNIAYSLCTVLTRTLGDTALTAPSMACAIFLLALESEACRSLQNVGDLARHLGAKYHVAKKTVMSRYKLLQDEIASWIEQIPWLDQYKNTGGRAKVSRRTIVARGLKDAVAFQERQSTDNNSDPDNHRKRQKIKHSAQMQSTAAFLLNPKGSPSRVTFLSFTGIQNVAPLILSLPGDSSTIPQPPTRLQRLVLERGGSDVTQISDEELFAQGELDAVLRTREEMEAIRPILDLESRRIAEGDIASDKEPRNAPRTKCSRSLNLDRVNMNAFEQFMESSIEQGERDDDPFLGVQLLEADNEVGYPGDLSESEGYNEDEDTESDSSNRCRSTRRSHSISQTESQIVIQEWRPLSP